MLPARENGKPSYRSLSLNYFEGQQKPGFSRLASNRIQEALTASSNLSYRSVRDSFPDGRAMRKLPFLNGIRAFEAAARAGSFTKAASELHVTPAAISRMVQLL